MDYRTFANSTGPLTPETKQASVAAISACRCFCKELRRMILAFAARTASIPACWIFGSGIFLSSPMGDTMVGSCLRAVEWMRFTGDPCEHRARRNGL
jgi:hypothetical protein